VEREGGGGERERERRRANNTGLLKVGVREWVVSVEVLHHTLANTIFVLAASFGRKG
jgi:hypothetical protein